MVPMMIETGNENRKDKNMKAVNQKSKNTKEVGMKVEADNKDMKKMTGQYVRKINKQAKLETKAWVEQGRLIKEFIDKCKGSTDAKLKALADHDDCIHGIAQLRNYKEAYEVYKALEDNPEINGLPMTFYATVQPKKLTQFKREELLKQAKAENWSVSQLNAAVKDKVLSGTQAKSSDISCKLKRIYSELLEIETVVQNKDKVGIDYAQLDELITHLDRLLQLAKVKKNGLKPNEESNPPQEDELESLPEVQLDFHQEDELDDLFDGIFDDSPAAA